MRIDDAAAAAEMAGDALRALAGTRLLLTGAGGFLAAGMARTIAWANDEALEQPCELIALVRDRGRARRRLGSLLDRSDVVVVEGDVTAPPTIAGDVDLIVHAASHASPKHYLADPLGTMDANVTGTRHMLELAREREPRSMLFFSSGEIYGDPPPEHVPTPEDYAGASSPLSPRACYTESKRYGESLCATYARTHGVPVKIVRPFHVYGPGLFPDDGRVVADFLANRLGARPIRILSDGRATRAFCYLADATAGFWRVLVSTHDGEAFNIGDDREPVSIADLARVVAGLEEPSIEVSVAGDDLPSHLVASPSRVCPDITKARTSLGFEPRTRLRDGLASTLASYREGFL